MKWLLPLISCYLLHAVHAQQLQRPLQFLEPSNFNRSDSMPFRETINDAVCDPETIASFVRVLDSVRMGVPTIVTSATLGQCSNYCQTDTEPMSGAKRACRGFNHQASEQSPSCELFDVTAKGDTLNSNVGPRTFYFQKICLKSDDKSCYTRPYAFTVSVDTQLQGLVRQSIRVDDVQTCLSQCLDQVDFICRSVNYDRNTRVCSMLSRDRVLGAHAETSMLGVDHYENNCLSNAHRCDAGTIHFVKVAKTQVVGADVSQRPQSLHACLNRCLLSNDMYCRSVEYSPATNECSLSDEDSTSSPNSIVTSQSSGTDWYEPVCIQGAARIHCQSPYLFERVPQMVMALPSGMAPIETLANVTVDHCMLRCLQIPDCKSFNHDRESVMCDLLSCDRSYMDNNQQAELLDGVRNDYYEVMCPERIGPFHDQRSEAGVVSSNFAPNFPDIPQSKLVHDHQSGRGLEFVKRLGRISEYGNPVNKGVEEAEPVIEYVKDDDDYTTHAIQLLQRAQRATDSRYAPRGLPYDVEDNQDRHGRLQRRQAKCGFEMKASHRNLKAFYRNDHPRIRSLEACQLMCESWRTFVCRSASYSQRSNLCSLSQLDLNDFGLAELTQYDPDYDFFIRNDCSGTETDRNPLAASASGSRQTNSVLELLSSDSASPPTSPSQSSTPSKADTLKTAPQHSDSSVVRQQALQQPPAPSQQQQQPQPQQQQQQQQQPVLDNNIQSDSNGVTKASGINLSVVADESGSSQSQASLSQSSGNSNNPAVAASGQFDGRVQQGRSDPDDRIASTIRLPQPADFIGAGGRFDGDTNRINVRLLAGLREGSSSQFNSVTDDFERGGLLDRASPQLLNTADGNGGGISVDDVLINADCMPNGVNVTVILPNQLYTGAIYAAERYSFCRTRVTARSAFSLFLQRPSINADCNTVELNDIMSAVVIVSNDRVLPYDVTTKDDLFYEVSCDYSGTDLQQLREGVLVRGGIVVG